MIGLIYIAFFVIYLAISVGVVIFATKFARNRGYSAKKAGWAAAIFMYLLVFWDWIPVVIEHKYLCETQAGFWEYKTPEEWIKENPDTVGEKWGDQSYWPSKKISENQDRHWFSSRIYSDITRERNFSHAIRKKELKLVDQKTGEVLARSVEFERGSPSNLFAHGGTFTDYKIWLSIGDHVCGPDKEAGFSYSYDNVLTNLIVLGKGEK